MNKVIVILGPTATGKTDLGIKLAKKFNGELIAADSRQVYKGLDIGTGKLPSPKINSLYGKYVKGKRNWLISEIKVWMYDLVSPKERFSVAEYVKEAEEVLEDMVLRKKLPIIVGGTGFYIKALLEGLPNLSIPVDNSLRIKLEKLTKEELQNKLWLLSPTKYDSLNESDKQNPRRLIRALEIILMNPYGIESAKGKMQREKWETLKIGLSAPREVLYEKVDLRIVDWITDGIVKETEELIKGGVPVERFKELGLEYEVLADFLQGKIKDMEEVIKIIRGRLHDYVRRQETWFKKEKDVKWFDVTNRNYIQKVENLVHEWYDK